MPNDSVARIIHLTDMHLHVDANGNARSPRERAATVRFLTGILRSRGVPAVVSGLAAGLNAHSPPALEALVATLRSIAHAGPPCVIVQSGDLEAYGATMNQGPTPLFPAFDYWAKESAALAQFTAGSVELFGNHDLWPGTLPILRPGAGDRVESALRSRSEFRTALPDYAAFRLRPFRLDVFRMNSVHPNIAVNSVSAGAVLTDYPIRAGAIKSYPSSGSQDPLDELVDLVRKVPPPAPGESAVRILVLHHPPHFFNATSLFTHLKDGHLLDSSRLCATLAASRFHLVIAGHRHQLNPSSGTSIPPAAGRSSQPPLSPDAVQLVATSPTQEPERDDERPAFAVYDLTTPDKGLSLRLDRTVFRFVTDLDAEFTPDPGENVVQGLSLA